MRQIILFFLFINLAWLSNAQWRGPNRDGKFPETGLLKTWPKGGPQRLITVEGIGKGWSSPISDGTYIYTTGMIDSLDHVSCIDFSGNIKWKVVYGHSWRKTFPDTRGSVTIDGDRLYVISGIGELVCLNKSNGTIIWKVNVDKDFNAEWHRWGVSETPLVVDDKVLCTPGGQTTSVVAFDKMNGKLIWQSKCVGGQRSYISPILYTYQKFRYILAATATHLIAIEPTTGDVAWSYKYYDSTKWDQPGLIWTNTPVYKGRDIFLSMGYDYRCVMIEMNEEGNAVSEKWSNLTLDNHHHGLIELDGQIYGSNWKSNREGKWVCLNWYTGELNYESEWINKGAMVYADGLFYIMEEKTGTVGLVKPSPQSFEVISSFKLQGGTGPFWVHPYIHEGRLFLRHGDVLFVYNIKA